MDQDENETATFLGISSGAWAYLVAQELDMNETGASNKAAQVTARKLAEPER